MHNKTILIVITDFGSFNNFLAELAVELCNYSEVHVLSSKEKIIDISNKFVYNDLNITFHQVEMVRNIDLIKLIQSARLISDIITKIRPDIVYAHFLHSIFPTLLYRKRKVIYWGVFHGLGMNSTRSIQKFFLYAFIEFYCFLRLDRIIVINKKDFRLVRSLFKEKSYQVSSVGVGCDLKTFNRDLYSDSHINEIKNTLNLKDKFIIAFTGRFVHFKGFHLVYYVFLELSKIYSEKVGLLLIGDPDPLHPTGLSKMEENDLKSNNNIIITGFTSEVAKYLAISDLFLFPSKKEGLPVCLLEALSMGIPAISLNERGCNDVIQDDFNGYLINSKSVQEDAKNIAAVIIDLINDENKLNELALNSLKLRNTYSRLAFVNDQLNEIREFYSMNL